MPLPLFVYGTLRDPDVLTLVLGHAVDPAPRIAALAPRHRVVFFPQRTYPALVPDPTTVAEGPLLRDLSAADLAALDLFEGDEYSRKAVEIIVSGTPERADVYWPEVPIQAGGPDWRLQDWTTRHKSAFLAAEARNITELRRNLSGLGQPSPRRGS